MFISYLYALALLIIIPRLIGCQPLGIFGLVMGSLGAWLIIGLFYSEDISKSLDEEYIGTYVREACYFTEWTERIRHEDKDTKKVTYETVCHPEEWEVTVAEGRRGLRISRTTYNRYVQAFDNEHEANADHDWEAKGTVIDPGTCYYTVWPGTYETACYRYIKKEYDNPTLRAPNVFQTEDVSEEDVKKYRLMDYAQIEIYGRLKGADVDALEKVTEDYNCWFRTKQIKLNFILLENTPTSVADYWRRHWKNGKRNTVNAIVGVNSEHKIQWVYVFGWQNEGVRVQLRDLLAGLDDVNDIVAHFDEIKNLLETQYHRADFKQYDYIRPKFPLKNTAITLTIFLSLFCGLFCRAPYPPVDAMRLIAKNNLQAAKKILEPYVLSTYYQDADAYNNLGIIYFEEKNYNEALRMLNHAIKYKENSEKLSVLYHNRSEIYKKLGNYKAALKDARKAVTSAWGKPEVYVCNLKELYKKLGYSKNNKQFKDDVDWDRTLINLECTEANALLPIITKEANDPLFGRFQLFKKIFS